MPDTVAGEYVRPILPLPDGEDGEEEPELPALPVLYVETCATLDGPQRSLLDLLDVIDRQAFPPEVLLLGACCTNIPGPGYLLTYP